MQVEKLWEDYSNQAYQQNQQFHMDLLNLIYMGNNLDNLNTTQFENNVDDLSTFENILPPLNDHDNM